MQQKGDINNHYLTKLHTELLRLLDEVDRVCREFNLHYYLIGGSCLGAVRHMGFIPWDDDLDVVMPREDFDKFLTLANDNSKGESALKDGFYLRWITTEKSYNQDFAKVCIKGTLFQEDNGIASQNAGIFVDIFPLDLCEQYDNRIERKSRFYKYLHSCLYLKGAEKDKMDWALIHWPRNIFTKLLPNRCIYKLMLFIINPNKSNGDYLAFYPSPYPISRQVFPKSWYGEGKRMQFENKFYMCPSEPEKVLQLFYGNNFMELPPINKRKTHYPIRVVFSDGEELYFEEIKNKVQYEDLIS